MVGTKAPTQLQHQTLITQTLPNQEHHHKYSRLPALHNQQSLSLLQPKPAADTLASQEYYI